MENEIGQEGVLGIRIGHGLHGSIPKVSVSVNGRVFAVEFTDRQTVEMIKKADRLVIVVEKLPNRN